MKKIFLAAVVSCFLLVACDESNSGGGGGGNGGSGDEKPIGGCSVKLSKGSPAEVARSAAQIRNSCGLTEDEFVALFKLN